MSRLKSVFTELKETFTQLHLQKEECFWASKMGLTENVSQMNEKLTQAEIAVNRFLQDPERLKTLRELESEPATEQEKKILKGWIDFFAVNVIEDPKAKALSEELVSLETKLQEKRGQMNLGFVNPATGKFEKASSIRLSLLVRTHEDEAVRKAAFEGLSQIEPFVLEHGFLEIVRKRNQLGRMLGFEDYYDWKVSITERCRKGDIFRHLDELAARTKDKAQQSLAAFIEKHGESARNPWNFNFFRSGSLIKELHPYYAFGSSVRRWGRSFAAMGIKFRGATLTLDLLDRAGKYENGFMHGPKMAFFDDGQWQPAQINFTANAVPHQVGGGIGASRTLFHEGGHAAHFSNILTDAPCFSHEFPPTSVAYAETQSMFLDSLISDPDWRVRYAHNDAGNAMPVELIERSIRETLPFRGWDIRAMMTIPFGERALYECPEDQLHPEHILNTFRGIEKDLQGLTGGIRPILTVPHLLSGEASAYYHGYVLAEMAVYQTRAHFLKQDGYLTDNPNIGPALAEHYWSPGNAVAFSATLESLTGNGLSTDALVEHCNQDLDEALSGAHASIEKEASIPKHEGPVELDATIRVIHGKKEIASTKGTSFEQLSDDFENWVNTLQ